VDGLAPYQLLSILLLLVALEAVITLVAAAVQEVIEQIQGLL
jgi:hypothetical protein